MNRTAIAAALAAVASLTAAGGGNAAVTVFDGAHAKICYENAKWGRDVDAGLRECSQAIQTDALTGRDLAGTYVNRGVLYMDKDEYTLARRDFDQAIEIDPGLGDAYLNRGAALIGEHRFQEGIDAITRGLTLGSEEPAKGYYNRALAYEELNNERAAYFDYMKASELAPTWAAPRKELKRFSVHPAP